MKSPIHFKNKEDYRKWLAYGHIHGDFARTPGNQRVVIGGRPHAVQHNRMGMPRISTRTI